MAKNENKDEQRKIQDEKIDQFMKSTRHKILIISGKGGVGKSSVAANLAIALSKKNYKTGILDADLHGPSITRILGLEDKKSMADGKYILPVEYSENLKVISMQFLLHSSDTPLIWRGPIKIGIIRQFLSDVLWGNLDFLIIDSPPGTGDEPLTVAQTITGCRAIIVTTPQQVAISDVNKSINFCKQVNMPVIGIIENMSGFTCPECGIEYDIFKKDGGKRTADKYKINFLGSIPIDPGIVNCGDNGMDIFKNEKTKKTAEGFSEIVDNIENLI